MNNAKREQLINDLRATGHHVIVQGDCFTVMPTKPAPAFPLESDFRNYDIYFDLCERANKVPLSYKAWMSAGKPER